MTIFHGVRPARAAVLAALSVGIASCGGGGTPPGSATQEMGSAPSQSASQTVLPTQASTPSMTDIAVGCPSDGLPHLATDLEGLLPTSVGGRDLNVWSTRGKCWLQQANVTLDDLATMGLDVRGIDLNNLKYAVAGRSDVRSDPAYFVTVLWKPLEIRENIAAVTLYAGVLGFKDANQFMDPASYRERVIGDKSVLMGDVDMVIQDEHLDGAPYLYETDDYLYVLLTADPDWAEEALSKLAD